MDRRPSNAGAEAGTGTGSGFGSHGDGDPGDGERHGRRDHGDFDRSKPGARGERVLGPVTPACGEPTAAAGGTARAVPGRIADRVGSAIRRVRRGAGRWAVPWIVDACLAAGLLGGLLGLGRHVIAMNPLALLVVHIGMVVPLAWRRRAPVAVFGCLTATALFQWAVDLRTLADVTLLIALYTVAAYRDRRHTLVAFAVLEGGNLLATLRWSLHERATGTFVSLSAMAIAAAVIGSNVRGRRDRMAFLEDRAVRLELERDQRAQFAVAGERSRIAREMHDIVTHNLSVMVALADGAVFAQSASPERAAAAMRQIGATGRQAITDMRRFLGVLRADEPDALRHPQPGIAQLGALAEQVRAVGLPTRLEVSGDAAEVPAAAQLTVYRLVQEALTNTLKHAAFVTRAEVRVACEAASVTLTVTDDGAGPVPRQRDGASGHGLLGMRERAAAYGGRLTAGPLPGGGWQVAAVLTLTTPEMP